ncbi:MAG TPA: nuclear transport factor 2 family protein [Candidatus Polarisedimenticolia bacterium]|nr:nuclear transport factor 2 family protein [Candidatus Polarisedimenticolia bacterium]
MPGRVRSGRLTLYCVVALLVLGVSFAQQPSPPAVAHPSVTLPAELARVLTDYEEAWRKKDFKALAQLFAEDGFVLASGGPAVRGRSAIEQHYQGMGGPLSLRALAYGTEGSVGYIIGGYSGLPTGPDEGKFTLTLRKKDGRWLIMSDMDNLNHRPRPQ